MNYFDEKKQIPVLTRKTVYSLLIILAVYSCLAFFRLGSTDVPYTKVRLQNGACLTISFDEAVDVTNIYLYKWYAEGNTDVDVVPQLRIEQDNNVVRAIEFPNSLSLQWLPLQVDCLDVNELKLTYYGDRQLDIAELCVVSDDKLIPYSVFINDDLLCEGSLESLSDEPYCWSPDSSVLTESYFDEFSYSLTAESFLTGDVDEFLEVSHPPLGKDIEALGIFLFGMNPVGWRFFGALAGVLMIVAMFFLARVVLKSNGFALLASLLLSVDAMHYTQTRMATIDSYPCLFILCAYLFMAYYPIVHDRKKERLCLLLSGISFGLACACKWIGCYTGLGLAICFFAFFFKKMQDKDKADRLEYLWQTFLWCCLSFIILPVIIYILSYFPIVFGPNGSNYSISWIWENQSAMLNYHKNNDIDYSFNSEWWQWPLLYRKFMYYLHDMPDGMCQIIISTGNPIIWLFSVPAICYGIKAFLFGVIGNDKVYYRYDNGLMLVLVAYLCQYLPWAFVSRELFIYHYFVPVTLSILMIAFSLKVICEKYMDGKILVYWYVACAVVWFMWHFPLLNGIPVSTWYQCHIVL